MKQKWLDIAEVLDAYRVFPRLFLFGYSWVIYDSYRWFKGLPEPSTGHTFMISTVWGMAAVITAWYLNTGRKWQ